jgi:hypothetical protein
MSRHAWTWRQAILEADLPATPKPVPPTLSRVINDLEHFRGASGHRFALRKCDKTKDWSIFPIRSDRKKL